jgi:hypothetical protein
VVVHGISPLIGRRRLTPADTTIAGRHTVLQIAFGWTGSHLHDFIHGREYGIAYLGGPSFRVMIRGGFGWAIWVCGTPNDSPSTTETCRTREQKRHSTGAASAATLHPPQPKRRGIGRAEREDLDGEL